MIKQPVGSLAVADRRRIMAVIGIIAEYNPFHNGHIKQLEFARKLDKDATIIVAMSGNWMQRGEPAIIDKWQRAKAAVLHGTNLVVELPLNVSVQPADIFANGAIKLLKQLGCDKVIFGAEHPDLNFKELLENRPGNIAEFHQFDQTYATAYQNYLTDQTGIKLKDSNDILAYGYTLANSQLTDPMELIPMARVVAGHQDVEIASGARIASAQSIRSAAQRGEFVKLDQTVPIETRKLIKNRPLVNWSQAWPLLKYRLMTSSPSQLRIIYQMTEGIEYRLKDAVANSTNIKAFFENVKSKRYTYTRIQRLCVYVLLQTTTDQMNTRIKTTRVLAFDDKGRSQLHHLKGWNGINLITRMTQAWATGPYLIDDTADQVWNLMAQTESNQLNQKPIYISKKME